MNKHSVATRNPGDLAGRSLFQSVDAALESIRQRAYEIFRSRDGSGQNDMDDWFRAERELFEVPPGELVETLDAFVLTMPAAGFEADQLAVAVDDQAITVRGEVEKKREKGSGKQAFSEVSRKEMFRRFNIPDKIDTTKVKANLADGYLKVTLPRMVETQAPPMAQRAAA